MDLAQSMEVADRNTKETEEVAVNWQQSHTYTMFPLSHTQQVSCVTDVESQTMCCFIDTTCPKRAIFHPCAGIDHLLPLF